MNPISARTLLLLLCSASLVAAAVDFAQCLKDFQATNDTGGVDSHGHPVSAANAAGLTYETCRDRCGSAAESFSWRQFAQLFSAWLLPWLALISQLPFGSGDAVENFVSIIMSVGSPALAAYSLMVTCFNTRMIKKKASSTTHGARQDVARVLIALQQFPLELTKDELLLQSIPTDDKWRKEILDRLDKKNAWTLAAGSSVAWVILAFAFTLVDSFVNVSDPSSGGSDGLAVGTLWLWLLCLVIGWLWVPIFSSSEIKAAIRRANTKTARSTTKKYIRPARDMLRRARGKHNQKPSTKSGTPSLDDAMDEKENEKQGSIQEGETRPGDVAELRSDPPKSAAPPHAPAENQQDHSVGGIQTAHQGGTGVEPYAGTQPGAAISTTSLHPEKDRLLIPFTNSGWLHRDEFRHPATFNYSRIMRYHVLVDDVFRTLDRIDLAEEIPGRHSRLPAIPPSKYTVFPPGVRSTMVYAAIFALILQCGITGAALIIIVFTPTVGLGCRSLGYVVYGGLAIIIMFLTMFSTILARMSEIRKDKSFIKWSTKTLAITIRCICLVLALLNSVGLIVLSCLQFSNFLANCYCNASVLGNGPNTYLVIILTDWITTIKNARAIGIATAAASSSVFMLTILILCADISSN